MRTLLYTIILCTALMANACGPSTPEESAPPSNNVPNNGNLAVLAATPTATTAGTTEKIAEPATAEPTVVPAPAVLPTDIPPVVPPTSAPALEPTIPAAPPAAEGAAADSAFISEGEAARISDNFQGELMANGVPYNKDELVAAHKDLPLGTIVRVTNLDTGLAVDVTVVDRMPPAAYHVIDVSRGAAVVLGMPDMGTALVRVEQVQ